MKQKLGLACSLIHPPRLLLLDEPSVGVDPISRRRAVEDGLRPGRSGHRRGVEHGLSRRGRAMRRGDPAERGEGPRRRAAPGAHGARRRTQLPRSGRGQGPSKSPGHGPQAPRSHRRRHPGRERPAGRPARGDAAGSRRPSGSMGSRSSRSRHDSRTPSSTCSAAVRKPNRRSPEPARPGDGRRHGRRSPGADQAVRRLHRRRPDHVPDRPGRDLRPARTQRRRQVDHVQDDVRALASDLRIGTRGGVRPVSGRPRPLGRGWVTWPRSSPSTAT